MSQGLCTSCGAAVNLAAGQDEINCTYCGTLVKRPEAEAQFAEVKNSKFGGTLLIAETAQEGGSYEEALNYYNKVIEQEPTFADAWLDKGICMVRTSKIGNLKIPEAISSWKAAIKFAKNPEAMKKRVATEINNVVSDFYPVLENHFREFRSTTNAHEDHASRFSLLESALALALDLNPTSKTIAENGIYLCDCFVKSVRTTNFKSSGEWQTGERLAKVVADPIRRLKAKYEQALARVDPSFAKQVEDRTEDRKRKASALGAKRIKIARYAIFLGWLGVHKFMLGYTKEGFVQMFLTLCWGLGLVIGVIEGLIYFSMSDEEFGMKYTEAKNPWF